MLDVAFLGNGRRGLGRKVCTYSDIIPPPDPATEGFTDAVTSDPVTPFALRDAPFEDRAAE